MECKNWPWQELFPTADLLGHLLMGNKHVTGVAVTGSLARFEEAVHDIDLVVFHDGALLNYSCRIPFPKEGKTVSGPDTPWRYGDKVIGADQAALLWQAGHGVPVELFFVPENILWNCLVLQGMRQRTDKEADFFRTVFCDIPLVLTNPVNCREGIKKFSRELPVKTLYKIIGISNAEVSFLSTGKDIQHRCGDQMCQPDEPWSEKRKRVVARKGHDHCTIAGS